MAIFERQKKLTEPYGALSTILETQTKLAGPSSAVKAILETQKREAGVRGVLSTIVETQKSEVLFKAMGAATTVDHYKKLVGTIGAASAAAAFLRERDVVGKLVDTHFRAIQLDDFDIAGLLDSTRSRRDIVRSTESLVDAIAALARDIPPSADFPEDHEHPSPSERDDGAAHSHIWMPSRAGLPSVQALEPIPVFCGHARKDKRSRNALLNHLSVLRHTGVIRTWDERAILPGEDKDAVVWRNLELAKIVLLLLSAEYLNELYRREMMDALEQKSKRAYVIPILVRPVNGRGVTSSRP